VDAGVIIHENRFTYQDKGLFLIQDLGKYWEIKTGIPIPLGGIIALRDLPVKLIKNIDRCINNSLIYAWNNEDEVLNYCRSHAQNMDDQIMKSHIALYVNEFSLNLGKNGKESIQRFIVEAQSIGKTFPNPQLLFLPD